MMFNRKKFTQIAKLTICASLIISLSGCYLSIGSGRKRKNDNDGDNIVVTTGGQAAPPLIINNTQPAQYVPQPTPQSNHYESPTASGERSLKPINR